MFENNYPRFISGVVLKAEMLENLSLYQRNMLAMLYEKYSDGILAGAGISIRSGTTMVVSPGIIKHNGMLYHTYEEMTIEAYPAPDMQYLKIRFEDEEIQSDTICLMSRLLLEEKEPEREKEIELCRFILDKGSVLRTTYTDLRDYSTLHDTVHILETPYAGVGAPSFSPVFLTAFAREMQRYSLSEAEDVFFVMECLKEEPIKREILQRYLCRRLGMPYRELANQEIYQNLLRIIEMVKQGRSSTDRQMQGSIRRMIVD